MRKNFRLSAVNLPDKKASNIDKFNVVMKDILENLDRTPYKVPEGYFETFADKLKPWEKSRSGALDKVMPYLSMAAMFAIIVAVGTAIMRFVSPEDELQEYGSLFYCDLVPYSDTVYYSYSDDTYEVSEDDIIEYLIYNGTSTDYIESFR